MNYNLIGKNSVGAIIILLLVILLSQAQFFDFMMNTSLGRFFLITIILFVSYIHKILGITCVLLIVLIFNNSDYSNLSYLEGMANPISPSVSTEKKNKKRKHKKEIKNKATEGFDIIGKERQLQKGRNSNSIPVNDYMKTSDTLEPHDTSLFSEIFSIY
jgi:hypothetical protein